MRPSQVIERPTEVIRRFQGMKGACAAGYDRAAGAVVTKDVPAGPRRLGPIGLSMV